MAFFTDPFGELAPKFLSTSKLFLLFIANLFLAPLTVAKTSARVISPSTFWPVLMSLSFFLLKFVFLHILQVIVDGAWALAWCSFIAFCSGVSMVRSRTRNHLGIPGHSLEDFCLTLLLYPCVAMQMELSTRPDTMQQGER
eukprot:TRINITY_DN22359_c0_g1_i1.p1 TRINITY_DN22359_c0_g1~~TRINITY_DN22359_c0_g1_i1.p1  ORF type:complete len:149 (-),score=51.65 TRINITY_DN22359_c0_g1_i1:48-470(-)